MNQAAQHAWRGLIKRLQAQIPAQVALTILFHQPAAHPTQIVCVRLVTFIKTNVLISLMTEIPLLHGQTVMEKEMVATIMQLTTGVQVMDM